MDSPHLSRFREELNRELKKNILPWWMQYAPDRELGEWYWSVDSHGFPRTDREKAGFWKCPYHNGRACMELIRRINGIIYSNTYA